MDGAGRGGCCVSRLVVEPALREAAHRYLDAGLCVLPTLLSTKFPTLRRWKQFQSRLPTHDELDEMLPHGDSICVVCGAVSGHLELLDYDFRAEWYGEWDLLVEEDLSPLLELLFMEDSQNGGRHAAYRCEEPVDGSVKLASQEIVCDSGEEIVYRGKKLNGIWRNPWCSRKRDRQEWGWRH